MTNETTASQPKSIGDDAQFGHLLVAWYQDKSESAKTYKKLIRYIDNFRAPAAQASATIHAAPTDADKALDRPWQTNGHGHYEYIETICDAYESGIGDGLTSKALMNPYNGHDNPDQNAAFEAGHIIGVERAATIQEPVMVAEPVAYADPKAFENFSAGTATNEWMWAKPDAGLVPLYRAAPMVADPAGVEPTDDRERFEALTLQKYAAATFERFTYGKYKTTWVQDHYEGWCMALAATVKAVPSEALEPADDFARGVIAALGAMTAHGHPHGSTYHDEIVRSVGEASIYAAAEDEDYEWAGLDPEKKPGCNFAAPLADKTDDATTKPGA